MSALHRLSAEITVGATGSQVTTGASSASALIPNAADGNPARHVMLQADGYCYVRAGGAAVAATVNDLMLSPSTPTILNVQGCSKIAYLQKTVGALLNITPLETG